MTLTSLLEALRRFWAIVVLGALLTAGGVYLATRSQPVYWTRTQAVFMAPSSTLYPNSLQTKSEDLIITAGLVAKRLAGPSEPLKFAGTDANLVGIPPTGEDYWIRLPDTGGQWAPNFSDQFLLVDAVGATPADAMRNRDTALALISSELSAMQREMKVAPVNDITVKTVPESSVVVPIKGSKLRAGGMAVALGAMATLAAVVALQTRASRRPLFWPRGLPSRARRDRRLRRKTVSAPLP